MKAYLSLTLMMISTFAWAMPSAKYIPVDTAEMITFHAPYESLFAREWDMFVGQNRGSSFLKHFSFFDLYFLRAYGVTPEMHGDFMVIDILKKGAETPLGVMFLEGTFDADAVLAKIRQSPNVLHDTLDKKGLVYGKMPGGIYACSRSFEGRVKALLSGEEKGISPTSAFAKLATEKNVPNRLAIRFLARGGKGGLSVLNDCDFSALKVSLIEQKPNTVALDLMLYAKSTQSIITADTRIQGSKLIMAPLIARNPAFKQFTRQFKTATDIAKKRFSWSGTIKGRQLEMLHDVFLEYTGSPRPDRPMEASEDVPLTTSPTFKVEHVKDFVENKESKTFTIDGHAVTVCAVDGSYFFDDDTKMPVLRWKITTPASFRIKEMTVTHDGESFWIKPNTAEDIFMRDGQSLRNITCSMSDYPTGDVDVTFQYHTNSLIKRSSAFEVEHVKGLVANKESKTFALEGATVTVRAESSFYNSVDMKGVRSKEPGIKWKLSIPKHIELKKIYVKQGKENLSLSPILERDFFAPNSHDRNVQNLSCLMAEIPTGDVQMILEYRIKDMADDDVKTSPIFTVEKLEDLVENKDQSKTFVIEGRTVTLQAKTYTYDSMDMHGVRSKDSAIKLNFTHPVDLDIENIHVAQAEKITARKDRLRGNRNVQGRTTFSLYKNITGDIQVVFEYRIKPID